MDYRVCSTGLMVFLGACSTTYRLTDEASLAAVHHARLRPGDRLVIGPGILRGTLVLDADDRGSALRPIVIESGGRGGGIIDAGAESGVVIDGAAWVVVRGIRLVGAGRKDGNRRGVGVSVRAATHIRINRVEARGFQRAGIEIDGSKDVRVTRVHAHDNGYAGICSGGAVSRNLHISRCRAINNAGDPTELKNHSGSGIVLMNVAGAMIDHCEAAENGWDMPRKGNGPVGIWCAMADRVTIQHCVSHHNTSPGRDGGGFDFDGGTTNSVMRHNRSHHNKGYGYLLYEYGSGLSYGNNTIEHCISDDDGEGGIGVGISKDAPPGTSLGRCTIRRNLIRNKLGKPAVEFFEGQAPQVEISHNHLTSDL